MKVAVLLLALVALSYAVFPQQQKALEEAEFRGWMRIHNKQYRSRGEYQSRFLKYQDTAKRIQQLNSESPEATFAHNHYSDLSPEEFKAIYLTARFDKEKRQNIEVLEPKAQAPSTFDWRTKNVVTAVKDQGQCGSCWAFSATENIESVWMLTKNITVSGMKPLAPQQIVDCDTNDDGCNGGDTITAFDYVKSAGGLEPEKDYPYTAEDGTCNFKRADVYATIKGYKYATNPNKPDETVMHNNLYSWAPLSICVDAASWQNYNGGILMASQCGNDLDHCVQVVGYDLTNKTPYWIVRNSWSASWGENGYIRLEYGKNTCGMADEATTVTE